MASVGAALCRDIRFVSDGQKTQAGCLRYYLEPKLRANSPRYVWRPSFSREPSNHMPKGLHSPRPQPSIFVLISV